MTSALNPWNSTQRPTTDETITFIRMTVWKPRVVVPLVVGSCTRPKTPISTATAAPAVNATSGTVMLRGASGAARVMGRASCGAGWLGTPAGGLDRLHSGRAGGCAAGVSRRLLRNLLNHRGCGVSRRLLRNLLNHRGWVTTFAPGAARTHRGLRRALCARLETPPRGAPGPTRSQEPITRGFETVAAQPPQPPGA